MKLYILTLAALAMTASTLTACARAPDPVAAQADRPASTVAAVTAVDAHADEGVIRPASTMLVYKSATCGCCGSWVEHMREAGFAVEVRNVDNLNPIKEEVGVPLAKGSCHTAQIGGYFIEGHVPAQDIKRLLAEKPDAKGLVVPGMPAGSPGMELPDGRTTPYTVELVARDGSTSAFARHGM